MEKINDLSYVPYSGNSSSCVVKSIKGNYFPGVRVENASFPLTMNAAQNALFNCLSEGEQPKAIYVPDPTATDLEFWKHEFNVWVYPLNELEDISLKSVSFNIEQADIMKILKELLQNAITKNSDFPVSALLKTKSGYISGVNIECSEWSLGLCAERVAIGKAISYGFKEFETLYVHTRDGEFSSPCGACRQVISEHMPHHPIHLHHSDDTQSTHFSSDLLPHSFRSSTLIKPTDN